MTLTNDSAMLLVSTLNSTLHAMDLEDGHEFQSYRGHTNKNYRSKAAFGVGEATVVMGDEDGKLWAWDVETVRFPSLSCFPPRFLLTRYWDIQGAVLSSHRAHDQAILWTAHHPTEQQVVTACADGTVKIWGKAK